MQIEIERKFLLKDAQIVSFLSSLGIRFKKTQITQFYTKITKNSQTIYKKSNQTYTKTIINGIGLSKQESQIDCNDKEYALEIKKRIGNIIQKTRYEFKLNNNPAFIDIFSGDLDGLCTLGIKFKDELYGLFFKPKEFINNFIISEVTDNSEFKNQNLALFSNPNEKNNINLKKESQFKNKMQARLPKNISSKDALRIFLLQIYTQTDISDTADFIQNIIKSYTIFKFTPGVFDKKTSDNFIFQFKNLIDLSWSYNKLNNCKDYIQNSQMKEFISNAYDIALKEFKELLNDENIGFLKEWEIFLNEESSFFDGSLADSKFIKILAYNLRKSIINSQRKSILLNDALTNKEFFNLYETYKEIHIILINFGYFYEFKGLKKFIKKLTEIDELFNELDNLDTTLKATQNYIQTQKVKDKISAKTYEKIYKIRNKIIKKSKKFLNLKRMISKNLKIYYDKG